MSLVSERKKWRSAGVQREIGSGSETAVCPGQSGKKASWQTLMIVYRQKQQ